MSIANVLLLEHPIKTVDCLAVVLDQFYIKVNGNSDPDETSRKSTLSSMVSLSQIITHPSWMELITSGS